MASDPAPVTLLLRRWRAGDASALDTLTPQVYDTLRAIAGRHLRRERPGHTWTAGDLVAEAFVRLTGETTPDWNDRVHFFAVAARHMRQILIDHARRRSAEKRGGGVRPVTLDESLVTTERHEDLLALDEALTALAAVDERKARVVELLYFGGMSQPEIAAVLDVHENTVARDLRIAKAWLGRHLGDNPP